MRAQDLRRSLGGADRAGALGRLVRRSRRGAAVVTSGCGDAAAPARGCARSRPSIPGIATAVDELRRRDRAAQRPAEGRRPGRQRAARVEVERARCAPRPGCRRCAPWRRGSRQGPSRRRARARWRASANSRVRRRCRRRARRARRPAACASRRRRRRTACSTRRRSPGGGRGRRVAGRRGPGRRPPARGLPDADGARSMLNPEPSIFWTRPCGSRTTVAEAAIGWRRRPAARLRPARRPCRRRPSSAPASGPVAGRRAAAPTAGRHLAAGTGGLRRVGGGRARSARRRRVGWPRATAAAAAVPVCRSMVDSAPVSARSNGDPAGRGVAADDLDVGQRGQRALGAFEAFLAGIRAPGGEHGPSTTIPAPMIRTVRLFMRPRLSPARADVSLRDGQPAARCQPRGG